MPGKIYYQNWGSYAWIGIAVSYFAEEISRTLDIPEMERLVEL
jgi:hypothetical protein